MIRKLFPILLILALGLSGCGLYISLPIPAVTPGPTVTEPISLPLPSESGTVDLSLAFGAGILKVASGASTLVSGTATYNIADFKPTATLNGTSARIEQGNWKLTGVPDLSGVKNEWDLELGSVPINLTVDAGAYQAEYHLGGLALTNLTIKDGAAQSKLDFATPNNAELRLLRYDTGASDVSLTGLGNANFATLQFNSGAGNYTLDFSGSLKRSGSVHIASGVSNLTLVIPQGIPVQLTVDGLANVTHDAGWSQQNSVYTQSGSGPDLTIVVSMGAGNVTILH